MRALLAAALTLAGCSTDARPDAPYVRIAADPAVISGAAAWEPLGFDIGFEDSGLSECPLRWAADGVTECQITINVVRGEVADRYKADRALRTIVIDPAATHEDLRTLAARAAGIILLNTEERTDGIMGGRTLRMSDGDRALACRTVHLCT